MSTTVLPSERRPSVSEEFSRPPLQVLPLGPGGESGCRWGMQFQGWLSRRRRSEVVLDNFVFNSGIAFQGRFEQHQRPTVEYGLECLCISELVAYVSFNGMWIAFTVYPYFRGLAGSPSHYIRFNPRSLTFTT